MRHTPLLLGVLSLLSCETTSTPSVPPPAVHKGILRGTVTYRERVALPAGALVTVRVWDALLPPETATVGEARVETDRQVPVPFEVFYDASLIQEAHVYGARASISYEGVTWFDTPKPVPVLTQGAPVVGVELVVTRVAAPP